MSLPHVLKRIRLELARSREFPAGSANHGYEFVAPLDYRPPSLAEVSGTLRSAQVLERRRRRNRATHAQAGRDQHARWVFDYDPDTTDDDEAGYRFGAHAFAPGEYVSIRGHEGESHIFKVVSVEPAA